MTVAGAVVRRAPFSDNPDVGPRGQRTQQRIVRAALEVLQRDGYHRCSVDRITRVAGCSRASFYQYFSSKEDIVHHLATIVAQEVAAAIESVDRLAADQHGRDATRQWLGTYGEIYQRYGAMFLAYETAAGAEPEIAAIRNHEGPRNVQQIRGRLHQPRLPARHLNAVISLLLECMLRTFVIADILHAAQPDSYPHDRVVDALTDVVHRTFFGLRPEVNVHPSEGEPAPLPTPGGAPAQPRVASLDGGSGDTLELLRSRGRDVFVSRGYNGTRVDDIVAAAGLSRGAFYRYFDNKAHLAQTLVVDSLQPLAAALDAIPDVASVGKDLDVLREWLRRYNVTHAHESGMIHVWIDATARNATLDADAAPALDWGRRRLAEFLRPRGFGDVDLEAVVLAALLDTFGVRLRSQRTVDAAVQMIGRGLLGIAD